jgi:hypothetical protein
MSRVIFARVASRVMPALLTRISIGPCWATIRATAARQASKSATSNFSTAIPFSARKASAASSLLP